MLWSIFCLLVVLLNSRLIAFRNDECNDFLIVIGKITQDTTRILVEPITADYEHCFLSVFELKVYEYNGEADRRETRTITLTSLGTPAAQVIKLENLKSGTRYDACFDQHQCAHFKTLPDEINHIKVVAISCNNQVLDGDASGWFAINHEHGDFDAMIHLGDQIYADQIKVDYLDRKLEKHKLIDCYRSLYRQTFTMPVARTILRSNAHYMLPDDHDLANNCDMPNQSDTNWQLITDVYLSAQQALLEYQYNLFDDYDSVLDVGDCYIYFGDILGISLLDVRVSRVFKTQEYGIIDNARLKTLENFLSNQSKKFESVIVGTSMPLMFYTEKIGAEIIYMGDNDKPATFRKNARGAEHILDVILNHDNVIVVGGDVHQYFETFLCKAGDLSKCALQVVTSGISRLSTLILDSYIMFYANMASSGPYYATDSVISFPQYAFYARNALVLEKFRGSELKHTLLKIVPHEKSPLIDQEFQLNVRDLLHSELTLFLSSILHVVAIWLLYAFFVILFRVDLKILTEIKP